MKDKTSKAIVITLLFFLIHTIGVGRDERNVIQASFCHQPLSNKE